MYESPAYWELKKLMANAEAIKRYVDLARTFHSMAYRAELTLSAPFNWPGDHDLEITLKDTLRTDVLEFLAQRCEDIAIKLSNGAAPIVDIRAACRI